MTSSSEAVADDLPDAMSIDEEISSDFGRRLQFTSKLAMAYHLADLVMLGESTHLPDHQSDGDLIGLRVLQPSFPAIEYTRRRSCADLAHHRNILVIVSYKIDL